MRKRKNPFILYFELKILPLWFTLVTAIFSIINGISLFLFPENFLGQSIVIPYVQNLIITRTFAIAFIALSILIIISVFVKNKKFLRYSIVGLMAFWCGYGLLYILIRPQGGTWSKSLFFIFSLIGIMLKEVSLHDG